MEAVAVVSAVLAAVSGVYVLRLGMQQGRATLETQAYLRSLDEPDEVVDEFEQLLREPFFARIVRPLGGRALDVISSLTPRAHLDRVHNKLVLAGLPTVRAEEFVTAQAAGTGLTLVGVLAWTLLTEPSTRIATLAVVGAPVIVALAFQSWLERKVSERQHLIRRELPDVLDLLAISVEAGTGFEGGLQIVTEHFESPLSTELSRTLKEMELGLSRRDALHNLKRRTEVPELSNFVLVLTQADALGMPIGRVLRTQAGEMRLKRRQWAREQAAKLPVKILFPLVLFIFPAVLVVVLGPAGASIVDGLR